MLKKVLSETLRKLADQIEEGCADELSSEDLMEAIRVLSSLDSTSMLSKEQACNFMKMSRSLFDSWVQLGIIPKGEKKLGFKELSWKKADLIIAKEKITKLQSK